MIREYLFEIKLLMKLVDGVEVDIHELEKIGCNYPIHGHKRVSIIAPVLDFMQYKYLYPHSSDTDIFIRVMTTSEYNLETNAESILKYIKRSDGNELFIGINQSN